jgi:hypothetical protein
VTHCLTHVFEGQRSEARMLEGDGLDGVASKRRRRRTMIRETALIMSFVVNGSEPRDVGTARCEFLRDVEAR